MLRERLLLKLEMLLEEAKRLGLSVTTFQILSGCRTPYYNQSIGNETRYSRHLYGDAADIYVDEDGDGSMDDLDGDGREDLDDAEVFRRRPRPLSPQRGARSVRSPERFRFAAAAGANTGSCCPVRPWPGRWCRPHVLNPFRFRYHAR